MMNRSDMPHDEADDTETTHGRRDFLVRATLLTAGLATASGAMVGCDPPPVPHSSGGAPRATGRLASPLLDAVGEAVLPDSLGADGRARAVAAFVSWASGYDPVAQEMLGYGYAEVRYLPADPVPGWRAQLDALDRLAQKRGTPFVALSVAERRTVIERALGGNTRPSLPAPLMAPHVVLALLSHWASSPEAWDLALGARVQRERCRTLETTTAAPPALPEH